MKRSRAILIVVLAVSVGLLVGAIVWTPGTPTVPGPTTGLNVIVLGVDGLDWFLLGKYMDEGLMPNLSRIFRSCVPGEIASDRPVVPHVGWTIAGRGAPLTEAELELAEREASVRLFGVPPALVAAVERGGGRAVSVGWPASWPVPEGDASNVAAYAPASATHPTALTPALFAGAPGQTGDPAIAEIIDVAVDANIAELDAVFAAKIHDGPGGSLWADEELDAVKWGFAADRIALDVAGRIIAEEEPDLALVYVGGLDAAAHRFLAPAMPDYFEDIDMSAVAACADVMPNYYAFIDEAIARLLRLADTRTLFLLCSAYGMHPSTAEAPATGGHELGPPGVLVVRGPHLPHRGTTLPLATEDLAPTMLAALGIPMPSDMSGRVLTDMLPEGILNQHPPQLTDPLPAATRSTTVPVESEEMERLVRERREALRSADD